MKMPLVSIVTPFLNTESFIEEAINSVLDQSYPHWELMLVDDGSTDGSSTIARSYAKSKPGKIHYLQHPGHKNLGQSSSRNLGILRATGDYIAFLDSDDIFLKEKLARQLEILESIPEAAMVYGPSLYWHSWSGKPEDQQLDTLGELGVTAGILHEPPTLLTQYLRKPVVPCICSLLIRREVALQINSFEESIQNLYEDQVFLAKVCIHSRIYVDESCYDRYRQHSNSHWHVSMTNGQDAIARMRFLNWLQDYLMKQEISDIHLWNALKAKLQNLTESVHE